MSNYSAYLVSARTGRRLPAIPGTEIVEVWFNKLSSKQIRTAQFNKKIADSLNTAIEFKSDNLKGEGLIDFIRDSTQIEESRQNKIENIFSLSPSGLQKKIKNLL